MTDLGQEAKRNVLKIAGGLRFSVGPEIWSIEPMSISMGEWVALVPAGPEPVMDPAGPLGRVLATLEKPVDGNVEIFGFGIYDLDHGARQRLRARIGFVHGYGGLISNRSLRENIALPLSVHGGLGPKEEEERVEQSLRMFALESVADLNPHKTDGSTRWRACLARALILRPEWLVMEGMGNWEMDWGRSTGWTRLLERHREGEMATVICLSRKNAEFEAWFEWYGGVVVRYSRVEESGREGGAV